MDHPSLVAPEQTPTGPDRRLGFVLLMLVCLAVDQGVKAWIRHHFMESQVSGFPWPGVFEITLERNKGVAWSLFQGSGRFMAPIALAVAWVAIRHVWKNPRDTRWTVTLAGLVAAGSLGNLIDRVWLGYVTDMFWFRLINFPVFNVADSCITIGTIMLMITWLREPKEPKPALQSGPSATEVGSSS